jgi:hypothetical protein
MTLASAQATTTAPSKLGNFKLQVATVGDTIKIKCTEGCSFSDLSFAKAVNSPQAVDYYGMTELKSTSGTKAGPGKDFMFTVARTSNGLKLVGVRGTAWEELNVNCRRECKRWADENGMAEN